MGTLEGHVGVKHVEISLAFGKRLGSAYCDSNPRPEIEAARKLLFRSN